MSNEIEALTSEIRGTTEFLSRLISRKFGIVVLVGICVGVVLKIVFS
jgi:hypothetical protein